MPIKKPDGPVQVVQLRTRLPSTGIKRPFVLKAAARQATPTRQAPTSLHVEAYVGVTSASRKEFETFDSVTPPVRLGPGAAVVRIIDKEYTTFSISAYAGNPHYLYGIAALAVVDRLYANDLVRLEDASPTGNGFELVMFCKRSGTDEYARRFIAGWKKSGGHRPDGHLAKNWEMWDRLNNFCALGSIRFAVNPFPDNAHRIRSLHNIAKAKKRLIRPSLDVTQRLNYRTYEEIGLDVLGTQGWPPQRAPIQLPRY